MQGVYTALPAQRGAAPELSWENRGARALLEGDLPAPVPGILQTIPHTFLGLFFLWQNDVGSRTSFQLNMEEGRLDRVPGTPARV